jgi:hypothetical protein
MFKHTMEFLKQHASLKNPNPKHYLLAFKIKDLSNKDSVALCELLVTEIGKPKRKLYATPGK